MVINKYDMVIRININEKKVFASKIEILPKSNKKRLLFGAFYRCD